MAARKRLCSIALIGWIVLSYAGEPGTDKLTEELPKVRYDLELVNGRFAGNAGPVITEALTSARYVIIGEDHHTREIPLFSAAVCDQMAGDGLAAFAVEAGPTAAEFVGASIATHEPIAAMRKLVAQYPTSMAFPENREEIDLLAHCAAAAAPRHLLFWGLDQEFLGAAARVFDLILATHPGPAASRALTDLKRAEAKAIAKATRTGDASTLWLLAANRSDVDALGTLIEREGNSRARSWSDTLDLWLRLAGDRARIFGCRIDRSEGFERGGALTVPTGISSGDRNSTDAVSTPRVSTSAAGAVVAFDCLQLSLQFSAAQLSGRLRHLQHEVAPM